MQGNTIKLYWEATWSHEEQYLYREKKMGWNVYSVIF